MANKKGPRPGSREWVKKRKNPGTNNRNELRQLRQIEDPGKSFDVDLVKGGKK